MHRGPDDDEPATIAKLSSFIENEGLATDIAEGGESPAGHEATRGFDAAEMLDALDVHGGAAGSIASRDISGNTCGNEARESQDGD